MVPAIQGTGSAAKCVVTRDLGLLVGGAIRSLSLAWFLMVRYRINISLFYHNGAKLAKKTAVGY
jgi:hypothetical protein